MSSKIEPIPKLSEDLGGPRHPLVCQSCSKVFAPDDERQRWEEYDDFDRRLPKPAIVVLCKPCSDALIEKHPRLYGPLGKDDPFPGAMPICIDCVQRDGVACASPAAKMNGGPGLNFEWADGNKPANVHLCRRGKGQHSGWTTIYPGPVVACSGKEPTGSKDHGQRINQTEDG